MDLLREETNKIFYHDIIYDWVEYVRNECDKDGSLILSRERTGEVGSIYAAIIEVVENHMTFDEEYLETDVDDQCNTDDDDDYVDILNDWKD